MRHFTKSRLFSILSIGWAMGAAGCTDYSTSVFIRQAQFVDPEDECVVTNDPEAGFISSGVLDTTYGSGYTAVLLAGNQLIPRGDEDQLKPEANRVQFYEAEIELLDQAGGTVGDAFFQTITGFADPADGDEPGYGLIGATLIPPGGAAGGGTVVARIIARGVTLGGTEVETAFWDFPILVCSGCLPCIEPASCEDELAGGCFVGQDARPDCRLAFANHPCNVTAP